VHEVRQADDRRRAKLGVPVTGGDRGTSASRPVEGEEQLSLALGDLAAISGSALAAA